MKVSVLLATKDRPDRIGSAVEAVLAQDWPDLEVIVKDASRRYAPAPLPCDDRIFRICGPDGGIACGFNEAARFATGEIMHNVNDDDVMEPGTIRDAVEALTSVGYLGEEPAMWTYGMLKYHDEQLGRVSAQASPEPWDPQAMCVANRVHQPTVFYRREAWLELGPFSETFRYAYDYEFWGRLGARWDPVVRAHYDATYHFWGGSTSVATPELVQADVAGIQAMWHTFGFGRRPDDA